MGKVVNIRIPVSFSKEEQQLKKAIGERAKSLHKSSAVYLKDLARQDLKNAQFDENATVEFFNRLLESMGKLYIPCKPKAILPEYVPDPEKYNLAK
jgi:hypothetical protein